MVLETTSYHSLFRIAAEHNVMVASRGLSAACDVHEGYVYPDDNNHAVLWEQCLDPCLNPSSGASAAGTVARYTALGVGGYEDAAGGHPSALKLAARISASSPSPVTLPRSADLLGNFSSSVLTARFTDSRVARVVYVLRTREPSNRIPAVLRDTASPTAARVVVFDFPFGGPISRVLLGLEECVLGSSAHQKIFPLLISSTVI
ncbi:hypothetical protein PVAR5_2338 [Paecilomyces variotii No. 5]|uniref:Uncharacterized protein n=1 Tax=Byssochlamys spectabilis (strain No. 5 / NBRC 109023) TaxID=1356009 RepID=V5FP40_BYSSN|nr:hypothetical protein PVAR5_2338 [Paecilomyces variotii No. 5]